LDETPAPRVTCPPLSPRLARLAREASPPHLTLFFARRLTASTDQGIHAWTSGRCPCGVGVFCLMFVPRPLPCSPKFPSPPLPTTSSSCAVVPVLRLDVSVPFSLGLIPLFLEASALICSLSSYHLPQMEGVGQDCRNGRRSAFALCRRCGWVSSNCEDLLTALITIEWIEKIHQRAMTRTAADTIDTEPGSVRGKRAGHHFGHKMS